MIFHIPIFTMMLKYDRMKLENNTIDVILLHHWINIYENSLGDIKGVFCFNNIK